MAERRRTVKDQNGNPIEGTLVEVDESIERFSKIKLKDGTILRIKPIVTETIRMDGQWDQDGHPVYTIRTANIVTIVDLPAKLKQGMN